MVARAPPPVLARLAASAGVHFNGDAPFDIQVFDKRVYRMILAKGSLGFGEAYIDGLWECERLDDLFHRLLSADIDKRIPGLARVRMLGGLLSHALANRQSVNRAFQIGEQHYDIGNDVFEAMLDPTMTYSCAYWRDASDLAQA